jgi:hypothetical protein
MSPASDVPAAGAFVASNGELAWRRQDIEQALHVLRDSGQAILGGEVWLITGEKSWTGLIPQRGGGPSTFGPGPLMAVHRANPGAIVVAALSLRASTNSGRCRLNRRRRTN